MYGDGGPGCDAPLCGLAHLANEVEETAHSDMAPGRIEDAIPTQPSRGLAPARSDSDGGRQELFQSGRHFSPDISARRQHVHRGDRRVNLTASREVLDINTRRRQGVGVCGALVA